MQSVQPFSRSGNDPCTCARAVPRQLWHTEIHSQVNAFMHAKFQRHRPSIYRVIVIVRKPMPFHFCTWLLHMTRALGVTHIYRNGPILGRGDEASLWKWPQANRSSGCEESSKYNSARISFSLLAARVGLKQGWQIVGINLVYASQWQKLVYVSLCRQKLTKTLM